MLRLQLVGTPKTRKHFLCQSGRKSLFCQNSHSRNKNERRQHQTDAAGFCSDDKSLEMLDMKQEADSDQVGFRVNSVCVCACVCVTVFQPACRSTPLLQSEARLEGAGTRFVSALTAFPGSSHLDTLPSLWDSGGHVRTPQTPGRKSCRALLKICLDAERVAGPSGRATALLAQSSGAHSRTGGVDVNGLYLHYEKKQGR